MIKIIRGNSYKTRGGEIVVTKKYNVGDGFIDVRCLDGNQYLVSELTGRHNIGRQDSDLDLIELVIS